MFFASQVLDLCFPRLDVAFYPKKGFEVVRQQADAPDNEREEESQNALFPYSPLGTSMEKGISREHSVPRQSGSHLLHSQKVLGREIYCPAGQVIFTWCAFLSYKNEHV